MEALVWIVDRGGVEPTSGIGTYYNGDVIIIKPDGWHWADGELNDPRWRLIRVALTQAQADQFSAFSAKNAAGHQWKRAVKFNWAALTPASLAAQFVYDGLPHPDAIALTVSQLQGIATTKTNP